MIKHKNKGHLHSKIVAVRNDRLGGRLGAILNVMRIAQDYNADFSFTWADHADVSPELQNPEHLFSTDFLNRHKEVLRPFGDLKTNLLTVETLNDPGGQSTFIKDLASQRDFRCSEAMKAVVLPWENKEQVSHRIVEVLDNITFSKTVTAAMEYVRDKMKGTSLIAYHLRRGDIIDPEAKPSNVLWPTKYLPRVFYEEHMAHALSADPDCRIVVFSDAQHELVAFSKLSERVIRADELLSTLTLTPLQRDFIELYTMSLCDSIIAPGASAFSAVAALLGNCPIKSVKDDLTAEQRKTALERLTMQMDLTPEVFAGDADLGQNFFELIEFHRALGTPHIALKILKKHFDRGFSYSYVYDLMAEQYFNVGELKGALELVEALRDRPILTNLGNAQSYAWIGLTAFAAGHFEGAAQMVKVANWLQPILPLTRVLSGLMSAHQKFSHNSYYPISRELFVAKPLTNLPKLLRLSDRLEQLRKQKVTPDVVEFIPFELEIRDWHVLQSTSLPAAFWNIPQQKKLIKFFQSAYRRKLDNPEIMSLHGQMYCQAGEDDVGEKLIEHAASEAPVNAFTQIRMARLRLKQGHHAEAQEFYHKAAELSNGQVCFRAEQGMVQLQLGEKPAAIKTFSSLAAIPHDMIEVLILTADVLRRNNKTIDVALSVAQRADWLAPGGLRTTQVLRKVLQQMGRHEEAEAIENRLITWGRKPGKFSSRVKRLV
jgi:tetratricopeptide (TPR) repeat protein